MRGDESIVVRKLAAIAMLAAALSSGTWLEALGSRIAGCEDHVCLCAAHCASKARCHETRDPLPTRVRAACSHARGGELPAPVPALLPFPVELTRLADLGKAGPARPRLPAQPALRPALRPPRPPLG